MFMISVRAASTDDLEPVTAAYTAAWREGYRDMFSTMVFLREDFDEQRQKECHELVLDEFIDTYVAEIGDRVVGFTSSRLRGSIREVIAVWVHPQAWGLGASRALLANLDDRARAVGETHLVSWLPEDSPRVRRLFESAGWRATGNIGTLDVYPDEPNRTFEYVRHLI